MRIAVTAKEASIDSQVDERFGRARYIIIFDTETGETQIQSNEVNLSAVKGAGIQTAQNIARLDVEAVITGHIGLNVFRALSTAGIKAYMGLQGTVEKAVEEFKTGRLNPVDSADVEGH